MRNTYIMKHFLKFLILIVMTITFTLPVYGYQPKGSESTKGAKKQGGKGHHGYGRPKGPPADIPAHIKERISSDGKGINLNGSQIGVKGIAIVAQTPELKNVTSMALKSNKLGDEGVRIITQSSTFKGLEFLSLWDNGISPRNLFILRY